MSSTSNPTTHPDIISVYEHSLSHQAHVDTQRGVGVLVRPGAATRDAWDLGGGLGSDTHRSTREEDLSRVMAKLASMSFYIAVEGADLGTVIDIHGHENADELVLVYRPGTDIETDDNRACVESLVAEVRQSRA